MSSHSSLPLRPIVLDLGFGFIKAGFAGEPSPRFVIESLIPKLLSTSKGHILYGETKIELRSIPNRSDLDQNSDSYSRYLCHRWTPNVEEGPLPTTSTKGNPLEWTAFDILAIMLESIFSVDNESESKLPPLIVVQSAVTPECYTQRLTQLMFETHGASHFAVVCQPVMTLYAMGKESGIVIESGYESTTISPVYCGRVLSDAVCSLKIGGRQITEYMIRCSRSDHQYPQRSPSQIYSRTRALKEQYGYTAYNYEEELHKSSKKDFVSLAFRCPEPLFQPHLLDLSSVGIHELVHQSMLKCDARIREELLSLIVLSGGNTLFNGLDRRLEKELQRILCGQHLVDLFLKDFYRSKDRVHVMYGDVVDLIYKYQGVDEYEKVCDHWMNIKVSAPSDRQYSAWIGTSQYVMEGRMRGNGWISREQYEIYRRRARRMGI